MTGGYTVSAYVSAGTEKAAAEAMEVLARAVTGLTLEHGCTGSTGISQESEDEE